MIFFDNSATTAIHPDVYEAMLPYLKEEYGNPSGKYYLLAENAKKAVEEARNHVAKLLGCDHDEVIFTSGSTESNNLILKGVAEQYGTRKHIITTKTEHPSILDTVQYLETKDFVISYLNVDKFGRANLDELTDLILTKGNQINLVSIIWANNELGTLNEINKISDLCFMHDVLFHTDATQIVGKVRINLSLNNVNFLSLSSHKLHGPKGIGACIIKKDSLGLRTPIVPLIHGGGQENGYRSGTLSVHNIVGLGKAAEIAYRDLEDNNRHLKQLEDYLYERLKDKLGNIVQYNSDQVNKIPGIVNIRFPGINNEILVKKLSNQFAISTGSACSSTKPSHVLQNIGLTLDQVRSSVRISFSRFNTYEEIDLFIKTLQG